MQSQKDRNTTHLSIFLLDRQLASVPSERKCTAVVGRRAIATSMPTAIITDCSNFKTGSRIGGALWINL